MERSTSLLSFSSRSSSSSSADRKKDLLLPYSESVSEKTVPKFRNPLGHCLYRRVLIWTTVSLAIAGFVLFGKHDISVSDVASFSQHHDTLPHLSSEGVKSQSDNKKESELVAVGSTDEGSKSQHTSDDNKSSDNADDEDEEDEEAEEDEEDEEDDEVPEYKQDAEEDEYDILIDSQNADDMRKALASLRQMPWLRFPHLNGYFHGLRTLVSKSKHIPEYPNPEQKGPFKGSVKLNKKVPKPKAFKPYDDADNIKTCYLDKENKTPAPSLYAYDGVPQHMPDPSIGSYDLFGIRDDVCFDRFGRYGPYGLGYRLVNGGTSVGMDTESSGSEAVWEESGQINYINMDWGDAQERCSGANSQRFRQVDPETEELEKGTEKKSRQAVVVRLYTGFKWTYLSVLNFRALVSEVNLKSGGEYTVHFLMHVRDDTAPIWSDDVTVQRILDANVPPEFHSMVTLWSEAQMRLFYPGKFGSTLQNPSGADVHGVYRSAHLPLQVFSMQHPEYEHIWNWEMDMRYLGNYYELFDRLGKWADKQPRPLLWERNSRYYIPSHHGTWENFSQVVEQQVKDSGRQAVLGPLQFNGKHPLRHEQRGESILPASCAVGQDHESCGVGEAADLITLNPMFDTDDSGWVFSYDATGYPGIPPRRCAIITASRLSKRLLSAMHEEVWRYHHTMFSEMFPPSVAYHHGFKGVYAPHPLYLDRAWSPLGEPIDKAFNAGQDHSTSGKGSPFDLRNEHNHKGTSWYYNSEFSGLLWRRWLGYAQMDGRGKGGGQGDRGTKRGGFDEESSKGSTGRMCLRSMLLHPIKYEDPAER